MKTIIATTLFLACSLTTMAQDKRDFFNLLPILMLFPNTGILLNTHSVSLVQEWLSTIPLGSVSW